MRVERIHKEYQAVVTRSRRMDVVMKKTSLEWIEGELTIVMIFPTKFSGPVKFLWSHDFGSSDLLD